MTALPVSTKRNNGRFGPNAELWVRLESFLSGRSPTTYSTYKGVLKEWSSFLGGELGSNESAKFLVQATDLHAMAYIRWLGQQPGETPRISRSASGRSTAPAIRSSLNKKKTGLESLQSNATIYKKVAALRRIYRMLISAGLVKGENPFDTDKVRTPPKDSGRKRPTEMIPFDKVMHIIKQADGDSIKQLQDAAILACLFGGALRRSEITELRLADFRKTASGTMYLYLRATKAGKDAQQALPNWASKLVVKYIKERVRLGAGSADFLFCSFPK
jgi:site-specific recombinase XerD